MKILFTTSILITGGIQTLMLRLAQNTNSNKDIEFVFLFFSHQIDPEFKEQLQLYSKIYFLDDYLYLPKYFKRLPIIIKHLVPLKKSKIKKLLIDIDHIHASNVNSILFVNKILRIKNISYSIGVYNLNEYILTNYKKYYFAREIENLIKTFSYKNYLFFNEISRDEYIKVYGKSLIDSKISPVGVDLKQFSGRKTGKKNNKIVSIGRLTEWKTYNFHIIDVIKKFKDQNINFTYDSYGDGAERKRLEQKVIDYQLQDQVKFHPTIKYSQFQEKITNSLMFIGAGTALIEASACGIPALIGIENEAIDNPQTFGFLHDLNTLSYQEIELNLEKKLIYNCIKNLYNLSEDEYNEQCNLAINRAKDFDIKITIVKFIEIVKQSQKNDKILGYTKIFFIVSSMIIHLLLNRNSKNYFKRL